MPVEVVEQKFIIKFIAFDRGKSGGRPAPFNSKLSRVVQPERPVGGEGGLTRSSARFGASPASADGVSSPRWPANPDENYEIDRYRSAEYSSRQGLRVQ